MASRLKRSHCPNFSFCKISKKLSELIQSYDDVPFSGPEKPICPEQFFFLGTNHCSYFHLPVGPFHCAKFFLWIQSCLDEQFLDPEWPISPNEDFFTKPVNEPCFFHSCLSTCQKSKSDINLLVKYWWLKNTEISSAESHFCL